VVVNNKDFIIFLEEIYSEIYTDNYSYLKYIYKKHSILKESIEEMDQNNKENFQYLIDGLEDIKINDSNFKSLFNLPDSQLLEIFNTKLLEMFFIDKVTNNLN
jgi:hypothetical protein